MATIEEQVRELDGIWRATQRAQRRRRVEALFGAGAALVSGVSLALGLYAIYLALAGF